MQPAQILDILEKAFEAGCFPEVHKMIKAGSDIVLIEKIIKKSKERHDIFGIDWDTFGSD